MVNLADRYGVAWRSPSPSWGLGRAWLRLPAPSSQTRPWILRFASDAFMEELLALVSHNPQRLEEWIARRETWREPAPFPSPIAASAVRPKPGKLYNQYKLLQDQHPAAADRRSLPSTGAPPGVIQEGKDVLRLFQPAHNRYYLVCASLVFPAAAHPDYLLNPSNAERATFVVRALNTNGKEATEEYAFVATPAGMAWRPVPPVGGGAPSKLIAGEEQLPLFPLAYPDACGRQRQLLNGLIPVGKREAWLAAPFWQGAEAQAPASPVMTAEGGSNHLADLFMSDVSAPWKALVHQAETLKRQIADEGISSSNFSGMMDEEKIQADRDRALRTARDQIQTGSWYVLLDLAAFLRQHLPAVWKALPDGADPSGLGPAAATLVDGLRSARLPGATLVNLALESLALAAPANRDAVGPAPLAVNLWEECRTAWELARKLDLAAWPQIPDGLPPDTEHRLLADDISVAEQQLFAGLRDQMRRGVWLTVLDVIRLLEVHLPRLRQLALEELPPSALSAEEQAVLDRLKAASRDRLDRMAAAIGGARLPEVRMAIPMTLAEALLAVEGHAARLNTVDRPYDRQPAATPDPSALQTDWPWPAFLFPLADPEPGLAVAQTTVVPLAGEDAFRNRGIAIPAAPVDRTLSAAAPTAALSRPFASTGDAFDPESLEGRLAALDDLADRVRTLLPPPRSVPGRFDLPASEPFLDQRHARFVIRCVFERPLCGALFRPLVSAPTRAFELAPFFDPDAPARPIRVPLPVDISPAGLRKYKKNTMFMISDLLCGKLEKIRKLTLADLVLSVLPWPFHKDLPDIGGDGPCRRSPQETLGMFCSLSIPIVTLCALVLLMIMVNLLDRIFRWIPYLMVCLPIPGLKGKEQAAEPPGG